MNELTTEKTVMCRWSHQDTMEDYYCVNSASDKCSEVVYDTDCNDCHLFFSYDDVENFKNNDEDTGELL